MLNSPSGKGPLRSPNKLGILITRWFDRKIYYLNLLKTGREEVRVDLATTIYQRAEIGPEVNLKLQCKFADVFSPLLGCNNLIEHHIEITPVVVVCCRTFKLLKHKKK